jgi:CMP-N-acetylneuraminic acid synthetase
MPAAWTMNGAIYLFRTPLLFAAEPSLYGEQTAAYVMPHHDGISIDSLDDWADAERMLELWQDRQGARDRQDVKNRAYTRE